MSKSFSLSDFGQIPQLSLDRTSWDQIISSYFENLAGQTSKRSEQLSELKKLNSGSKDISAILQGAPQVAVLSESLLCVASAFIKAIGEEAQHFQHTLVDIIGRARATKLMLSQVEGSIAEDKKLTAESSSTWKAIIETVEEAGMQMAKILMHLCGPKSAAALASQVAGVVRKS